MLNFLSVAPVHGSLHSSHVYLAFLSYGFLPILFLLKSFRQIIETTHCVLYVCIWGNICVPPIFLLYLAPDRFRRFSWRCAACYWGLVRRLQLVITGTAVHCTTPTIPWTRRSYCCTSTLTRARRQGTTHEGHIHVGPFLSIPGDLL